MKHNRILAAVVACLMVLAAVFLGLQGKPVSRDGSLYLTDKAGVISPAVESQFVAAQQNASPRLSVAIVKSTGKLSTASYCEALWENWRLGTSDMLLLMVTGEQDYYFGYDTASSFAPTLDANFDWLMEKFLEPDFAARNYEQAVLSFAQGLEAVWWQASSTLPTTPDNLFDDYYGGYYEPGSSSGFVSPFGMLIVIVFVVIFIAVVTAGSIGKKRPGSTTVYQKPSAPGSYRPTITVRPGTAHRPSTSFRPSSTTRPSGSFRPSTSSRPRTGGFGGSGRSSGGFGGGGRSMGGRSGGFGGGGRSGGMGGRGRR